MVSDFIKQLFLEIQRLAKQIQCLKCVVARIGLSEQMPEGIMKDLRIRARSVVFNFHIRSYTLLESRNTLLAE